MHTHSDKIVFALALGVYVAAIAGMLIMGESRREDLAVVEGRRLVTELNCADCAGATEEGLREGITLLEQASTAEQTPEVSTLQTLAQGYNTLMHRYLQPNTPDYAAAAEKLENVQQQLILIETDDPAVMYEYAATVAEGEQQVELLHEVARLDPTFAPAHHALGAVLYERGETDAAIEEYKAAVRHAEPLDETSYYVRLLQVLKAEGRLDEAEEFADRFNEETLPAELFQQDSPQ